MCRNSGQVGVRGQEDKSDGSFHDCDDASRGQNSFIN
jgi:hypothetical protein